VVQRVEVAVLCDNHLKQGEDVEAVWSEVVSIGRTTRRVELCDECSVNLGLSHLEDWLRENGTATAHGAPLPPRRPTKATGNKESFTCEECGEGPFRGKQGLSMHNRRIHLGSGHDAETAA
jgi:hypothetical protein